ncbi:DMT family transporter [Herminiimonas fonticola]|uniref:Drug/metabolite transporter (DMT)-like permease n=1 Tax=Herminiimonas fonticola TaxID=303380 RepID=A0A4R6G6T0_9BURK|nr:DMT family transporter [Herminiimonas fonticola]RBA23658.1 Permeases of the drug/metabolite transporter (DMT) superfamily [Herminiimonas fonticola]TDN89660.1 drug/metabolite transporter (DMT)-like permease [Herminiimonas fonticola]
MHKGVVYALLAAALFGASTPFSKMLVGQMEPVMLAGLLYLGSGLGLLAWYGVRYFISRDKPVSGDRLTASDLPWLSGAILTGGVAGPVLLMIGLAVTPASSASLLLNMEGVLTAMLAWFVFKENFDRRIFIGMILIVIAGALLSWGQRLELGVPWGALAIIAACLCWAIDNNLTRKVSASDAVQIAGIKGLVAGSVNLSIALALSYSVPEVRVVFSAGIVGFCGYGLSLVMFVLSLRHLGTARTGAYFSAAPFVGAVVSLLILGETPNTVFWIAAALMGAGIWLHVTEVHAHEHTHSPIFHSHAHRHDEHHQHEHDFPWDGKEPHVHPHQHKPLVHSHSHFPDIHHRHPH